LLAVLKPVEFQGRMPGGFGETHCKLQMLEDDLHKTYCFFLLFGRYFFSIDATIT
jgi:hypothetical protein